MGIIDNNEPDSKNQLSKKLNKRYIINKKFQNKELYKDKTKSDDVLKIKNIVKIFYGGKKAVDEANLYLYEDEIFVLLGHNVAGKTTLFSMFTGLYEATEDEVLFDEYDMSPK